MKILRQQLDKIRPHFEAGGRLEKVGPVFQAMDNFFFAPSTSAQLGPFIRDPLDVKRYMTMVIIALMPALAASVYFFGLRVLVMVLVSYTAGGLVEVLFAVIRKEEINEGFLVTGMIFPMLLPPAVPLWMVAAGVAFGVFFGKELFGGTGRNLVNPALLGRCFLALGYPAVMSSGWIVPGSGMTGRLGEFVSKINIDALSAATPLVQAKQGVLVDLSRLLIGNVSGSAGETSALLIIAGGLFLMFTKVSNWRTVTGILLSAFLLQAVLHHVNPSVYSSAQWHIMAGGLLLGAFFMASDPVTSPSANAGKWIYGAIIGTVTILIRNFTGYVEGVMFAILLGNIAAPLIDEIVHSIYLKRLSYER